MGKVAIRTYERDTSVIFLKTQEAFGGLSNMAGGYPLVINDVRIYTSEALYQACRFPLMPEVQKLIISQTSPMTAKMRSKPFRADTRKDWLRVRVRVMKWCITCKLVQNWTKFSSLLQETGTAPIVEQSRSDMFWGATPDKHNNLVGANVLGRLLMELRETIKNGEKIHILPPPDIEDFLLYGMPIREIKLKESTEPYQRDTLF